MPHAFLRTFSACTIGATLLILLGALASHLTLGWLIALAVQPAAQWAAALALIGLVGLAEACTLLPDAPASVDIELQLALFPGMPAPVGLARSPEGRE